MIRFLPCQDWHISLIDAQADQIDEKSISEELAGSVVANSLAFSCWIDGKCVGAAGMRPIWAGRAAGWMLLGRDCGPAMPAIVKKLRFFLTAWPGNRVETTVRESFEPGCRLVALMGFCLEARLAGFFPDGSTALLYTRLKHG